MGHNSPISKSKIRPSIEEKALAEATTGNAIGFFDRFKRPVASSWHGHYGSQQSVACVVPSAWGYTEASFSIGENHMGRLNGKVAVITGATSGIGLRSAEVFVAEGAKIVIAGRRAPEGEALAGKLGANCIFLKTDVTVEEQMRALIGEAVEKFGRIDCLFNNAGGPAQTGGIEGLDVSRFDAAMATLVRSVMLGMKHAAPHMKKQGSGSIINNGSIAGRLAGFSSSVVYGAAKAAVIHLTKCVAMELGESGIRVNSISPGAIATGIFGKALGLSVEAAEKTPDVMREIYKTAQPIQRAGLPEDIAYAAVFLASDESSFINGHDLVIDGAITGGRNWTQQQQGYVAIGKAFDQGAG
jgi:NAD(P)-dependent dehydrogenase (short-subunit alcohol dehydrogenase family)